MPFKINPITGQLDLVNTSTAGSGDVTGPASSTDNAITRFDGITGKVIQNSLALLQDGGAIESQGYIQQRIVTNDITVHTDETIIAVDPELTTGNIILEGSAELFLL